MYKIKKNVLEDLLEACTHVYPKEFLALIGSTLENEVIDEYVVLPADYGDNFSAVYLNMKPFDRTIIGSVHSHPSQSNKPSAGDLQSFPKYGRIHLIIAYPYFIQSIAMYDSKGNELLFEVVKWKKKRKFS